MEKLILLLERSFKKSAGEMVEELAEDLGLISSAYMVAPNGLCQGNQVSLLALIATRIHIHAGKTPISIKQKIPHKRV